MKNRLVLKLAASALVLGGFAIGCTPATQRSPLASASTKGSAAAADAASDAAKALKAGKSTRAVATAEKAVSLAPENGAYRALLGQAYLQAGRFASAEMSLSDALSLDRAQPKAALSLALAQIALGRADAARATLAQHRGLVPDADAGLALALAGDHEGSVASLEPAARAAGADAKTRQNLALAYALAGRWREAQVVAAQDVPADQLAARLQKWAAFARPRTSYDQVAALLGVNPVADAGMPTQLALRGQPVQTAHVPEPVAPAEMVAAAEAQASATDTSAEPVAVAQAPATEADLVQIAAEAPVPDGRYVVQLGAYSSQGRAEIAWNNKVDRVGALASYAPGTATVRRRSLTVHRLAALGFDSRAEAERVCAQVKARGGDCFVRVRAGDSPVRWASRPGAEYAAR